MVFNKKYWLLLCSVLLFAQQIWALSNTLNTDYLRTLNRSASMGSSDAMFFNPAGLIYLSDGSYFDFDLGLGVFKKEFDFQNSSAASLNYFPRSLMGTGAPAISLGYAKKEDNHALYFTLSPTMSSLFSLDNALSGSHETSRINYKHYDVAYEAALGYAMQVHEIVAVSFGGKLLMQFQGADDTYYTWGAQATALNERYRYHGVLVGPALHAGVLVTPLSWLAVALNLHSGSVLVGGSFVSHEGFRGPDMWESEGQGRPQGGLMTQSDPARMDLGVLFNIGEIAKLQLSGQMQLRLFPDRNGFTEFNQLKPHVTWNIGTGVDFNLPANVVLGFGVLYSNDLPYAPSNYYELLRAVELNQLQSIAVGLGFCVPVGSLSIAVSGMMPIYFDGGSLTSEKLSLSVPRLNSFTIYHFVFSLGLKVKWGQLEQQSV